MANTATVRLSELEGANKVVYGTIAFSGTYATGGETISAAQLGLVSIKDVSLDITSLTTAANLAVFAPTTGKAILVVPAGTQVANGASLTGVTASFRAVGA